MYIYNKIAKIAPHQQHYTKQKTMEKLKDTAKITSGLALGKTLFHEKAPPENGLQLLRPQDLSQNTLLSDNNLDTLAYIIENDPLKKRIKEEHYIQQNDILITSRGTVYQAGIIKQLAPNRRIIISNNMICLRPNNQNPEAILMYLNSDWFKQNIIKKEFPKMLSLSVKWLSNLPFTLPNDEERAQLSQTLSQHQTLINALQALKAASQTALDAKLFSYLKTEEV